MIAAGYTSAIVALATAMTVDMGADRDFC